ncbi:MAG: DUF2309 domain-containing protein [Cyclobacteriaceae bacterium]
MSSKNAFREESVLKELKHYLPAQAPLKDFVHHNTLHAFQDIPFEKATRRASKMFGYKTTLSLQEYQKLYALGKIKKEILEKVIEQRHGKSAINEWSSKLHHKTESTSIDKKIGKLRSVWKDHYHLDLDTIVHTTLFKILNSYLDQGIAINQFPVLDESFLSSIRRFDKNTWISLFKTDRSRRLLSNPNITLTDLLHIIVGDEDLFEQYLFDQQFQHPGWSGLISTIEDRPGSILDRRNITLKEMIFLENLLEIDNLDNSLGKKWKPLCEIVQEHNKIDLFDDSEWLESDEMLMICQEAFEWTYYDNVLAGIKYQKPVVEKTEKTSFQAFFCIDDRECSIRRYTELFDPKCETYGTPGHFGIDCYYQPKDAKFYTQICPPPITPKHLIKEVSTKRIQNSDVHFVKSTHYLFRGWIIAQTLGFWSAIKMMFNIFKPTLGPASSYSFEHMDEFSLLTVENRSKSHTKDGLQIGYTLNEMVDRVEMVLKSTGLVKDFAPLVYIIGHGASSANNTHYAGYDCGACAGRPGSTNARSFSYMANHRSVRKKLKKRGIVIPDETEFIGTLHDTTRDTLTFYDAELLSPDNAKLHTKNIEVFKEALKANAKERSRRFFYINTDSSLEKIQKKVQDRSVSLFEPRPELNHATNSLCIIGRRHVNRKLFLDRRAFLNSYDYRLDPEGHLLLNIINAAAPVCGGINLEYYFSRVDNEKLGAGSKLPHNVMGLIGVANGFEGDLRPGLPWQMVELHDPLRLLMIIEQLPEVVLKTIQVSPQTYEWFINEWIQLVVIDPVSHQLYHFKNGEFNLYNTLENKIKTMVPEELFIQVEKSSENLPVFQII